jgi:hypothetical protein
VIQNALNIIFAYAFVGEYGVEGLAWAFSLAYLVAALIAHRVLSLWARGLHGSTMLQGLARLALAGAATAVAAWAARDSITGSGVALIGRLAFATTVILVVYVLLLAGLGLLDATRARTLLPGNRATGASPSRRDG